MARRWALVALTVFVALAGCSTVTPGTDTTPIPTATSSPTETVSSAFCPDPPEPADVSVPDWPERPEEFTRQSVLEYAVQFERAYVTRDTLEGSSLPFTAVYLRVDTEEDTTVTRTDDGWPVRFWVTGPYAEWRTEAGATDQPNHWDPGRYLANYVILDERVIRAQSTDPVGPDENGYVVPCPPN